MAKVSSKNVTKKSTKKKSSSVKSKESKVLSKLENTSTNNAINTTRSNTLLRTNNVTQPDVASESNSDYSVITTNNHDDNKTSSSLSGNSNYAYSMSSKGNISVNNANAEKDIYHSVNLFSRDEINTALYNKTFRFGLMNPYGSLSTTREYLFFTKPDLHILSTNENLAVTDVLNPQLCSLPYWVDLYNSRKNTISALQLSYNRSDPFNHLLQNQVISNLDIPGLSAEMIDTPVNMYGVGYQYRGSSEAADDNPEFSLEFRDTKFLDTYTYFKTYEEYETLKHHGIVSPSKYYIKNKILHDAFAIYKFLVDEDMETIVYYGKMYGVTPKSLPRDVFSSTNFDNGISYSIDFKAAFYEDMKPDILADFNKLSINLYKAQKYQITPYNSVLDHADTRPAKAAYVVKESSNISPTGYVYKLKWKGSDVI